MPVMVIARAAICCALNSWAGTRCAPPAPLMGIRLPLAGVREVVLTVNTAEQVVVVIPPFAVEHTGVPAVVLIVPALATPLSVPTTDKALSAICPPVDVNQVRS